MLSRSGIKFLDVEERSWQIVIGRAVVINGADVERKSKRSYCSVRLRRKQSKTKYRLGFSFQQLVAT